MLNANTAAAAAGEPCRLTAASAEATPAAAAHTPKTANKQRRLSAAGAWLRDKLCHSKVAQRFLLGVTLVMTSMVLADGVLTPSISGTGCRVW